MYPAPFFVPEMVADSVSTLFRGQKITKNYKQLQQITTNRKTLQKTTKNHKNDTNYTTLVPKKPT
jgi:hypothetical protein